MCKVIIPDIVRHPIFYSDRKGGVVILECLVAKSESQMKSGG